MGGIDYLKIAKKSVDMAIEWIKSAKQFRSIKIGLVNLAEFRASPEMVPSNRLITDHLFGESD